jgi:hypothetical protein
MPPVDPTQAAAALARLEKVQARFRDVQEERRQAIVAAVEAGTPLREVARAADCSHESVRRIVAADGAVTVELDGEPYRLTSQQVEMLIYKLAGSASGAFPRDVELLGAGTAWLRGAAELARALQRATADAGGPPVTLDKERAFALYQILRITYTGRPTTLSRLYDSLFEVYGKGGPHVIAQPARQGPQKR